MRKIEKCMLDAIKSRVEWASGNTEVGLAGNDLLVVRVYGHKLAWICKDGSVVVNLRTVATYPTQVTKSRLRALGVRVCTIKHITYMEGDPVIVNGKPVSI